MSFEPGPGPEQQKEFASLQGCFVEGSAEQRARERKIRRRALALSVAAQCAVLTLIVLIPLFGKPERIALAGMVPIPPYYHNSAPPDPNRATQRLTGDRPRPCFTCPTQPLLSHPTANREDSQDPPPDPFSNPNGQIATDKWGILASDNRPQPPRAADTKPPTPQRVFRGHLEPAMLIYRAEPVYPALARQIRLEGRVELRAVISTDGTIQSLQLVSGHPLLIQSAMDAVRQWRYRPTILNGSPVEIDTFVTVVYTLQK